MTARFVLSAGVASVVLAGCASAPDSAPIACRVGERPPYFVPSGERLALLGCARLGVGGRRVDFNADLSRIRRETAVCLSPAYTGRGHRGVYQPAICPTEGLSRFAVHQAFQPRQAVRDYELVIWGTAGPAVRRVVADYAGFETRAAVLPVRRRLAARYGEEPFALFAVELPLAAGCVPIAIEAGAHRRTIRPRRGEGCRRWALLGSNQ